MKVSQILPILFTFIISIKPKKKIKTMRITTISNAARGKPIYIKFYTDPDDDDNN